MNALFVAQSHRSDVVVYLVLEATRDYSRTIRFDSNELRDIGGFHEQALLAKIAKALDASIGMGKEESRVVPENPCFLLTDHLPMPRKSFNSLERLGAKKISLGPRMLFASQCVTLIQHELDCRE